MPGVQTTLFGGRLPAGSPDSSWLVEKDTAAKRRKVTIDLTSLSASSTAHVSGDPSELTRLQVAAALVCQAVSHDVVPTQIGGAVELAVQRDTGEQGVIMSHSPNLQLGAEPFCSKCGYVVDPLKAGVKVIRKSPPAFQCSRCNSKQVMLYSMFGRWPLDEFKDLDDTILQKFWQTPVSDRTELKKSVEQILVTRLTDTQLADDVGPYLPLKTWADAPYHFDPDAIAAKAPMRMHPILGPTYQVKIVTTGERRQRDLVQETMAKLMSVPTSSPAPS